MFSHFVEFSSLEKVNISVVLPQFSAYLDTIVATNPQVPLNKFIFNHNKQRYNAILVAFLSFYDYEKGIVI